MKKIYRICLLGVILDQIIKIILSNVMEMNSSIRLISNFFNLTYVTNTGAAWSILSGGRVFLIIAAFVVLFLIYILFIRNKYLNRMEELYYGLITGGIIGNLLDRIFYGYVIDYLDFNIFGYNFPVFNLADILITVGAFIMIIEIIKGRAIDERVQGRK